ncbi:5,6-dimethylbenzimidazole synthase [uncultured Roseibium sp.]|uniref:5,6-dimethylbenzimidazole synthase n=1 Tax=uncultured Roseibium sp. TaxID=1936171 RepID=UPI003216DFB0
MPPVFDERFEQAFETLLHWRRDVRRFRTEPLADGLLDRLLDLADLAPSVGNSQPWRVVLVEDPGLRAQVVAGFESENRVALEAYEPDKAALYARLKLAGLREAPVHLAVFCDCETDQGHGLGRRTMPETLQYSVVGMIQTLWLAARIHGVGVGWVSIVDPAAVHDTLDVPADWQLVAYLCVGYPQEEHTDPELEREGWQGRTSLSNRIFRR